MQRIDAHQYVRQWSRADCTWLTPAGYGEWVGTSEVSQHAYPICKAIGHFDVAARQMNND